MNKNSSSLLALLLVAGVAYYFRAKLAALFKPSPKAPPIVSSLSGAPTPGYAAGTNPWANINLGGLFGAFTGFGVQPSSTAKSVSLASLGVDTSTPNDGSVVFIPQDPYNPNAPSGGLGITGYD